jgi:hypothetical protein
MHAEENQRLFSWGTSTPSYGCWFLSVSIGGSHGFESCFTADKGGCTPSRINGFVLGVHQPHPMVVCFSLRLSASISGSRGFKSFITADKGGCTPKRINGSFLGVHQLHPMVVCFSLRLSASISGYRGFKSFITADKGGCTPSKLKHLS